MYDLIGDIHGHANELKAMLERLGYSVAKLGGKLVAYRWDGEAVIDPAKFVAVDRLS